MATRKATTPARQALPLNPSAIDDAGPTTSIRQPITWIGYTFPPDAAVRFVAAGQQLEARAAAALDSGLFDLPCTNPDRAAFLREWVRSGCVVPGSIDAAARHAGPET